VELEYEVQKIVMPPWAGEEVTGAEIYTLLATRS
jgi:CYTH domain-containing protein